MNICSSSTYTKIKIHMNTYRKNISSNWQILTENLWIPVLDGMQDKEN